MPLNVGPSRAAISKFGGNKSQSIGARGVGMRSAPSGMRGGMINRMPRTPPSSPFIGTNPTPQGPIGGGMPTPIPDVGLSMPPGNMPPNRIPMGGGIMPPPMMGGGMPPMETTMPVGSPMMGPIDTGPSYTDPNQGIMGNMAGGGGDMGGLWNAYQGANPAARPFRNKLFY